MIKESQDSVVDFPSQNISVKKAPIWNYFKVLESDKSKASCDDCGANFSLCSDKPSLQTTTSLKRHLKRMHQNAFSKYLEEMNEKSEKRLNKKDCKTAPKSILNKSKRDKLTDHQNEVRENIEACDFKSEVLPNFSDNPWQVESIDAFYYLKCPECSFDTMDQDFFEIHATDNHPLSFTFFGQTYKEAEFDDNAFMKNESLTETIMIKNEPIFDSNEVGDNISGQLSSTNPIPSLFEDPLNMTNTTPVHEDKESSNFYMDENQESNEEQSPPKSTKRGPIWNFFKILKGDKRRAACNICGEDYSLGSDIPRFQTSRPIKRHLELKHKHEYSEFLKYSVKRQSSSRSTKKGPNEQSPLNAPIKGPIWNYFKKLESDQSRAICNFCGDDYSLGSDKPKFQSTSNLKKHLKTKHENEYLKFLKDRDEKNGIKSEEKDYVLYYCSMCSDKFSKKSNLKHHIEMVHESKKYNCFICSDSFPKKGMLRKHLESVHKGEKPFQCTSCDSGFLFNLELKNHYSSVHGDKKHKCTICTKCFSISQHLKRHIESVHEGMTRYACEICGKGFYDKRDLEKHITCVHEGMKPFECPNCEKCFALKVLRNN